MLARLDLNGIVRAVEGGGGIFGPLIHRAGPYYGDIHLVFAWAIWYTDCPIWAYGQRRVSGGVS